MGREEVLMAGHHFRLAGPSHGKEERKGETDEGKAAHHAKEGCMRGVLACQGPCDPHTEEQQIIDAGG